jgi:hypothetical protein
MFNYIKYSGLWITVICNPFHWQFSFFKNPNLEWPAPNRTEYVVQLLMLSFRLVIDDGSW